MPKEKGFNKPIAILVLAVIFIIIYWKFIYKEIVPPPKVDLKGVDSMIVSTIQAAEKRLNKQPHSATAWGTLGIIYWVNELKEPGGFCLKQAIRLDPKVGKWVYFEGLTFLPDDKKSAIASIEKAADMLDKDSYAPRLRLANILSEDGDFLKAEPHFRQVLERYPGNPMALLGLGHAARVKGEVEEATKYYEQCMDHAYTKKAAHTALAAIYLRNEQPEKADASQKVAESIAEDQDWDDPFLAQAKPYRVGKTAWLESASSMMRRSQFKEALPLIEKIIQFYPDTSKAHIFLGKIRLAQKQYQDAETALRKALNFDKESVEALVQLGVCLYWQQRFDESIAMLESALIHSPELAEAHYNLGLSLASTNKKNEAKTAFAKAIRSKPSLVDAYIGLATMFIQDQQIEPAYKTLLKAKEVAPTHPRVMSLLQQFKRTKPAE